jgi:hypothetical protein
MAWRARTAANASGGVPATAAGVGVSPGATQLTVIPSRPSERASVRATPTRAALLATYASRSAAGGSQIVSETTNTIRPKPRSAMPGAIAWASHTADSTLTAWTRRQVRGSRSGSAARSNAAAA